MAIEAAAVTLTLVALVWFGLMVRAQTWKHTSGIRYADDMKNAWRWGKRAAQEAFVPLYDRVVSESPDHHFELDYMPLRLGVMTLWARSRLETTPAPTGWQDDYVFNLPLLRFNTVCEGLSAAGVFALAYDWRRRERGQSHPLPMRPLHGVWLATTAFTLAWLNPASLLSAHARPTWDVWLIPFFVWAVWSAARGGWLIAGCLIGLGTMFKGQELIVAPLFILWPMMRFRVSAALRFLIGFTASIALVASPWLVGPSLGAVAFVLGCSLLPVTFWACLKRWPILAWSMPAGWLRWMIPSALAAPIAACVPLFGGSINWLNVGLIYGADKFEDLEVGGADSLAAILQNPYHWHSKDPVQSLQWMGSAIGLHVTISHVLVAIYAACLLPIAWAMSRYERAGDRRFVLAAAAPWIVYFAVFPKMHERYLLWGAIAACASVMVSLGATCFVVLFGFCSGLMSLYQMLQPENAQTFLLEISPTAGQRVRDWIVPTYPGFGWAILLATAIWLWMTVTGAFSLKRPAVNASTPLLRS